MKEHLFFYKSNLEPHQTDSTGSRALMWPPLMYIIVGWDLKMCLNF